MRFSLSLILLLSMMLVGCSDRNDEPSDDSTLSYKLLCNSGGEVAISSNGKDASITTSGYQNFIFTVQGEFANVVIDSSAEWVTASCTNKVITIKITAPENFEQDDEATVHYTIFNDAKSASGKIVISYVYVAPPSPRDVEQEAILYFLSDKKVNKDISHQYMQENNFEAGDDAPFYYNDPAPVIAFKVLKKGDGGKIYSGDKVYIRYMRWNLMDNYLNQTMPEGYGNAADIASDLSYFFLDGSDDTTQGWGVGIQVPVMFGLEYGSEVEVVVASPAAGRYENSLCIPYLYRISYIKGADSDQHAIPYAHVYLSFATVAEWSEFGPATPGEWKYFNQALGVPSGYSYNHVTGTGFGGVIVARDFEGNILAYDAACPVERDANIVLLYQRQNFEAVCPNCGSRFHIFDWPGVPASGIAAEKGYAMKRYNVSLNSAGMYLTISD